MKEHDPGMEGEVSLGGEPAGRQEIVTLHDFLYKIQGSDRAADRLEDLEEPSRIEIIITRTWGDRLFSLPWRPHHDVEVFRTWAWIQARDTGHGTDPESCRVGGFDLKLTGKVRRFTRRRSTG